MVDQFPSLDLDPPKRRPKYRQFCAGATSPKHRERRCLRFDLAVRNPDPRWSWYGAPVMERTLVRTLWRGRRLNDSLASSWSRNERHGLGEYAFPLPGWKHKLDSVHETGPCRRQVQQSRNSRATDMVPAPHDSPIGRCQEVLAPAELPIGLPRAALPCRLDCSGL